MNIFMIGHSNHPLKLFKTMVQRESISIIYDIRMIPFSRYVPQYNQTTLPAQLDEWGVEYRYRNDIGPRFEGDEPLYDKSGFNYKKALNRERIISGLSEITAECSESSTVNIAIMATKREPLECHRFLILSRQLIKMGHTVSHILPDETVSTQFLEEKLIATLQRRVKRGTVTLPEECDITDFAYFTQSEKIAKIGMKKYSKLKKKGVV